MSGVMKASDWQKYINAVNAYSDSVAIETIIWRRLTKNLDFYGEGEARITQDINLNALVAYNAFRTWPVDKPTETGIVDKEYCHIYLNNAYLNSLGYLSNNLFAFNPEFDRFVINGLTYKPSGDTAVAQGGINPLFQVIILERETTPTGVNPRP